MAEVCEMLEMIAKQVSEIRTDVDFIKAAIEKKEMEIDSKRWEQLKVALKDLLFFGAPIQDDIGESTRLLEDKLDEMKKEILEAINDSE